MYKFNINNISEETQSIMPRKSRVSFLLMSFFAFNSGHVFATDQKEEMKEEVMKKQVKSSYGEIAKTKKPCFSCGTAKNCNEDSEKPTAQDYSLTLGYSSQDLQESVDADLGLGCGNPTAIANLKIGEVVVDLGSGGGFDCFLASKKVGPFGRVIGVDMTPEMIELARTNALKRGVTP